MGSGITLTETDPVDIATPAAGKDTIFMDATASPPAPAYKDSSNIVTSLIGPAGPAGPAGPSGSITVNPNGALDGDGSGGSPLGVLVDNVTIGINASNEIESLLGQSSSRQLWQYRAKTSATSGYPGDGYLLWDNATQTSAANLLFSHITQDSLDIDIFLSLLASGDTVILQDADASGNFQEWTISGAPTNTNPGTPTSYWTLPVTLVSSGGTGTTGFANNHSIIAVIYAVSSGGAVSVAPNAALDGNGTIPSPLAVLFDNETIGVDSNNKLQVIAPYIPGGAVRRGLAYSGGYLDVNVDNETIGIDSNDKLQTLQSFLAGNGIVLTNVGGAITISATGDGFWTTVTATADQDVTSNTTMANDNELFFTIAANKVYEFEAHILYVSTAGAGTPDFKFTFNGPATLTGSFTQVNVFNTGDTLVAAAATALAAASALGTAATPRLVRVFGWVLSTTGGSGSSGLVMQWAQNSSSLNATTRLAGSCLRYRKMTP